MAKGKASPRQQQILDLRKKDPEISAADIAKQLKMTEGAVYQQITRLRKIGLLPKAKGKGGRPRLRTQPPAPSTKVEPTAKSNGHLPSLEEHLADELEGVVLRIDALTNERTAAQQEHQQRLERLNAEEAELAERRKRLGAANKALIPATA